MNHVTVVGSINLDTTLRVKKMARPGETIHTSTIFMSEGGKGANQAVAAKRAGARTAMIGAVGKDAAGEKMLNQLVQEGIDCQGVAVLEDTVTGQAFITVNDQGENSIMIHGGANVAFTPADVRRQKQCLQRSDFVIAQFESSIDSTIAAFQIARRCGIKTILNPAPARKKVPEELLSCTDLIVPNETETEIMTGVTIQDESSMVKAAEILHQLGIEAVIITLGSQGAFYDIEGKRGLVPAFSVQAVDTTAAGDTFIGAMSSILKKDFSNIQEAVCLGCKASSLAVQRLGAQPSIPFLDEML
ncbi:ribokinase [Enterococcus florum]|uniref:Ribokinase n=1 Tax=Enterococcus florum TaxID=2480627 RepID=A0A4P5PCI9_9ENTE|nr:ribokinase [Enterococcus florum]GCF95840.1 ribokinase [Enterococcus florum]